MGRRNGRGLFDLTRQEEDVACRLLNLTYGGDLIHLNREWPNCPAIDLADETRRICVQVTAIRKAVKANKAAKRLQRYHSGKYDRLLLFQFLGKPAMNLPQMVEGRRIEYLDMDDLMTALHMDENGGRIRRLTGC